MARRKSKKEHPEEEPLKPDAPGPAPNRKLRSQFPAAWLMLAFFTIAAMLLAWLCVQQQHNVSNLLETFTAVQQRVTNLQGMESGSTQTNRDFSLEQRLSALKEAQKRAQEQAEVALVTSQHFKNSDLLSQLLPLQTEMSIRGDEIHRAALYVTTLQGMLKNQSGEIGGFRERAEAGLKLTAQMSGKVDNMTSATLKVVERLASLEDLQPQLEDQASELSELHGLLLLHKVALHAHNQDLEVVKRAIQAKQVTRAQALKKLLNSVHFTLDEQFFISQILHSTVTAQLQAFQSKLSNVDRMEVTAEESRGG